jgi:peptidyl-prolyl cis-trans isomerase D
MFESIRKNTRIMALLLGIVVIPAFVLVGVNGYTDFSARSEPVAQVGSEVITQEQWDRAHQAEIQRIQRSAPGVDLKLLDSPQARYATLERLVQDLVLTTARNDQLLTVSDQRLAQALVQDPVIASLRDDQGQLDAARYRELLAAQGFTPESYEATVRADLAMQQVTAVVAESAVMPEAVSQPILDAFFQRRTVALRRFEPQDYESQLELTEADVRAFYDANPQDFQAPETVDIDYVVLDRDALARDIVVDEEELRNYYEQNKAGYTTPERRRVRHILIEAGDDEAASKAQAEAVLARVQAAPQDFAAIAKEVSADPGSAAEGGDLGWVDRGAMVKPFEDAAFALQPQAISELVQTEFGWHIIQVTEVQPEAIQSFAQVRAQLLQEVQQSKARTRFAELVEPFTNMVYEQAKGFDAVAEKFGIKVQQQAGLTRQGVAGVLSNRRVLDAIFSPESLSEQTNTDAIEVDRSKMVSARVTAHVAAHTQAFDEVKDQARARLLAQRSAQAAQAAGEQALAAAQASGELADMAPEVTVSRDQSASLPPAVLQAVLEADSQQLPAWLGVSLGEAGYSVVRLDAVAARPAPEAEVAQQEREQLRRSYAAAEVQAYVAYLRAHYKTEILVPKPTAPLQS